MSRQSLWENGVAFLAALGCTCAFGSAQTYVVDAAGGSGSHFRDLPAAIAAVPAGSVLRVRSGLYSAFTLSNKRLSILGDDGAVVDLRSPVTLGPSQPGDDVVVHGLVFQEPLQSGTAQEFVITNTAGSVLLSRCTINPVASLGHRVRVNQANDVHFLDVRIPAQGQFLGSPTRLSVESSSLAMARCFVEAVHQGTPGYAAMSVNRSRVTLVGCELLGGDGSDGTGCGGGWRPPSPGGAGLLAVSSVVHVSGASTRIVGGDGGVWPTPCHQNPGASGGPGVDVRLSTTRLLGFTPIGGAGSSPGQRYVQTGGSLDFQPTAQAPVAALRGVPQPGQVVDFVLQAAPNATAALVLGDRLTRSPTPALGLGELLVVPVLSIPIIVPAHSIFLAPLQLPVTWPCDVAVPAQWFALAGTEIWASNAFVILAKSP